VGQLVRIGWVKNSGIGQDRDQWRANQQQQKNIGAKLLQDPSQTELRPQLDQLKQDQARLEEQMLQLGQQISQNNAQIQSAYQRLAEVSDGTAPPTGSGNNLQDRASQLQQQIAQTNADWRGTTAQIQNLQSNLNQDPSTAETQGPALSSAVEERGSLEQNLQDLQTKLDQVQYQLSDQLAQQTSGSTEAQAVSASSPSTDPKYNYSGYAYPTGTTGERGTQFSPATQSANGNEIYYGVGQDGTTGYYTPKVGPDGSWYMYPTNPSDAGGVSGNQQTFTTSNGELLSLVRTASGIDGSSWKYYSNDGGQSGVLVAGNQAYDFIGNNLGAVPQGSSSAAFGTVDPVSGNLSLSNPSAGYGRYLTGGPYVGLNPKF
jgi:phage shock protein A